MTYFCKKTSIILKSIFMKRFTLLFILLLPLSSFGVEYVRGDVNGDGVLNIADVTRLISIVLSNEAVDQYVVEAGDMTGDGVLTIGDVTALASYINNNTLEYIPDIEI